jgi:DNA-binding NtrC family response regulator
MSRMDLKMELTRRILIVDDEYDILNITSKFFAKKGYVVKIAENGFEALKLFTAHPFDIVLTDFNMPHMNGLKLALEIKKRIPNTIIIMMCGDPDMDLIDEDCVDFIVEKPFKLHEIYEFLQCAINSDIPNSRLLFDNST